MANFWKPFRKREAPAKRAEAPKGVVVPATFSVRFGNKESMLKISAVNRAVTLRANAFATAKCSYEHFIADENRWEVLNSDAYSKRVNWLLKYKPNSKQNAKQAFEQLRVFGDMYGEAALYVSKIGSRIEEFIPVKITGLDYAGNVYQIDNALFDLHLSNVSASELLIIRGISTDEHIHGVSLFDMASNDARLAGTIDKLTQGVYDKGGTFRAIIKQESAIAGDAGLDGFSDDQMELTASSLQDQFNAGVQFAYDPSAGAITPITQSFQDLQLDMHRTKMVESIARHFGVPLPLMMSSTNAVYKSVDDAWLAFEKLSIEPMLQELEEEMNSKLLNEYDVDKFRFHFERHALCMQSEKEKAEVASIWANVNATTAATAEAMKGGEA